MNSQSGHNHRKLIEVSLPLEAINQASVYEKFIRTGHPNNLHQWWSRKPLAAARGVIFASLIDDPGEYLTNEGDIREEREDVVLYCNTGDRSATALKVLEQYGFTRVWSLEGGIVAWKAHKTS